MENERAQGAFVCERTRSEMSCRFNGLGGVTIRLKKMPTTTKLDVSMKIGMKSTCFEFPF